MASSLQTVTDRISKRSQFALDSSNRSTSSIVGAVATGLFAGLMMVIMTVTYASLIFSGELSQFISIGISLGLTSVIVVGSLLAVFSRSSHIVVQIDDDTAPVFALLLSILVASLPIGLSAPELLMNILVALFAASLVAGITLTIFGIFHFGSFVQFLPYSVMGGYFAAVGWLLLTGAVAMLSGIEAASLEELTTLFQGEMLWRWVPAVILGFWLAIMSGKINSGALLAGTVLLTIIAFYAIHHLLGNSPSQLMEQGHLIGPFAEQSRSLIDPVSSLDWSSVQLNSSLSSAGSIASITLISLLSIILCISGLSLTTRKDLDVNHELKVAGYSNIASSLLGGMSALPSLSISKLAYDIQPRANRAMGVTAVLVGIITFYFGMTVIAHIPKLVLGALLVYIGLGFVKEWLIDGYRKFGALEYSVIPIILIVSIFAGFLQGIVTGIVAAIILFVIKYSRIKIIRYQATGTDLRSNVVRDADQNAVLKTHGNELRVFTLQGYLFFGTAGSLYLTVLETLEDPENDSLKYVILDFAQVIGVDSSATLNFEKLAQRLAERNIYLITTNLKKAVLEILRRGGLDLDGNAFLIQHRDLDQGLEWFENDILEREKASAKKRRGIFERLNDSLPQSSQLHRLMEFLEKSQVTAGELLTNMGDSSDRVFFLESCTASAYIIDSQGIERRVSGAGRGAIYGEIGFLLDIPRTALVRADTDGEIYSLNHDSLNEMEKEAPELASAIMRYIAQTVTERLANTTQSLRAVL